MRVQDHQNGGETSGHSQGAVALHGAKGPVRASPLGYRLTRQFNAGDAETRQSLCVIREKMRAQGLAPGLLDTVELVLAEVLNNLSEHAYVDGKGPVDLSLAVVSEGIHCRIADRGQAAPAATMTAPRPPLLHDVQLEDLPEGGWGWYLITTLSVDVRYVNDGTWNVLTLTVPWDA